ncbi:MAG: XrtA system polysaccharide deacetylase [Steroidobacteraceae bacterium]
MEYGPSMQGYVIAFATAMVASLLATPVAVAIGRKVGALDLPGERKIHARTIPRIGGIAVAFAFFVATGAVILFDPRAASVFHEHRHQGFLGALALGAISILVLGIYDDLRSIRAPAKLLLQVLIAAGMWGAGLRIEDLGGTHLGLLSLPVTVFWLVGVTNAFNLIDGLDGLSAGVALFALTILFGVSLVQGSVLLTLLSLALGGSLIGFLAFNFNPAKIFLGDCGSMFLGLVMGAISVWTNMKSATVVATAIPIIAFGVPILDTALAFLRRALRGVSPFRPDAEHLHHRFLTFGVSHRQAVLDIYGFSVMFCLGAIALLEERDIREAIACGLLLISLLLLLEKAGIGSRLRQRVQRLPPQALADLIRSVARDFKEIDSSHDARWEITRVTSRTGVEQVQLSHRALDRDGNLAHVGLRWETRYIAGKASQRLTECRIHAHDLRARFRVEDNPSPELNELISKVTHDAFRDLPLLGDPGIRPASPASMASWESPSQPKRFMPSRGNTAILSVDVEDWFHILDLPQTPDVSKWVQLPSCVEKNFLSMLDLFSRTQTRVTCFFLGWVAERFPHLVREAAARGHEIACHGYSHQLAYSMTPDEFYQDIVKGKAIIEQALGAPVSGYRCPGFSATTATPWFFDKVAEAGFTYDSSVFPASRGHGGLADAQLAPYIIETKSGPLMEFPISVARLLGRRICCFGGGYLRLSPYVIIRSLGRRISNEHRPIVFYVHPREIDTEQPRLPMSMKRRFQSYVNIRGTRRKLERIAVDFDLSTFSDYVAAHRR